MYISDKIVSHGDIVKNNKVVGQYVIIRSEDYPAQAGMSRTTYGSCQGSVYYAEKGQFEYETGPDEAGYYVGVDVSKLKEFRPMWCITKDDLLAHYEAMQRESCGPIKNLDLSRDPQLLAMAKKLWAEKLASKTK